MDSVHCIVELEERLQFKHLPHIAFETALDEQEIRMRGSRQEVPPEAQELGNRFIREIEASYLPAVSVRFIHEDVGYGLFAEEALSPGAYVGEYTGIVRRNDRRYFEPLNNYCYEYPVPDEIGRSFVLDATAGNLTRFINHSSTPNLKPAYAFYDGLYHLIFLAICPIEKGSQLTYDYGPNYWYVRQPPHSLSVMISSN